MQRHEQAAHAVREEEAAYTILAGAEPDDEVEIVSDSPPIIAETTAQIAECSVADAVMMLRVQAERMNGGFFPSAREYSVRYGLNDTRLALLPEHAAVLHPGPMLRGMEIGFDVADAPQSVILNQVRAGVHVRMAVLFRLLASSEDMGATPAHHQVGGAQ